MNDKQHDLFGAPPVPKVDAPRQEPVGRARGGKARADKLSAERRVDIARKAAIARWKAPEAPETGPVPTHSLMKVEYVPDGDGVPVALEFDAERQGIWATQEQIGAVFAVNQSSVSRHIRGIFSDGELSEESNMQKVHIARSDRPVTVYSLDVVISVGYRVNSRTATHFRRWATQTLRTYVEQGYVLNDKVLREHPEKLNRLAAEVRALRSSEKHIYAKVRECFRLSASDYDSTSQAVRSFYALLQDKFHHAVTGMTSSKLILDRADHLEADMGLQTVSGDMPTIAEVKVGKNYLRSDELYRLHLLCEQFLLFAEATALSGRSMTMESLQEQLDRLLTLNNYPVFDGYLDWLRDEAINHAVRELRLYRKRREIEGSGARYDPEALANGEYDPDADLGDHQSAADDDEDY
jgi:hypothetical protein